MGCIHEMMNHILTGGHGGQHVPKVPNQNVPCQQEFIRYLHVISSKLVPMEYGFLCLYTDVPVPQSSNSQPNISHLK